MPYRLRKAPKRDLYWVIAQDGRHMSKEPIPLERAKAQMRALYANENKKGGADELDKWLKPIMDMKPKKKRGGQAPSFEEFAKASGFQSAPEVATEVAPGKFVADESPTDVIQLDEKMYKELMSRLPTKAKWEASYKRRGVPLPKTYEQFKSEYEAIQRSRASKNVSLRERQRENIGNLFEKQELYKEYIQQFPEMEEITCPYDLAGNVKKTTLTRADCGKATAEWERINHPANYYFFRPAVDTIAKATGALAQYVPGIPQPLRMIGQQLSDMAVQANSYNPVMSGGGPDDIGLWVGPAQSDGKFYYIVFYKGREVKRAGPYNDKGTADGMAKMWIEENLAKPGLIHDFAPTKVRKGRGKGGMRRRLDAIGRPEEDPVLAREEAERRRREEERRRREEAERRRIEEEKKKGPTAEGGKRGKGKYSRFAKSVMATQVNKKMYEDLLDKYFQKTMMGEEAEAKRLEAQLNALSKHIADEKVRFEFSEIPRLGLAEDWSIKGKGKDDIEVVDVPKKKLLKIVREYLKKMNTEFMDLIEANHQISLRTDLNADEKKFIVEELTKRAHSHLGDEETESDEGGAKYCGGLAGREEWEMNQILEAFKILESNVWDYNGLKRIKHKYLQRALESLIPELRPRFLSMVDDWLASKGYELTGGSRASERKVATAMALINFVLGGVGTGIGAYMGTQSPDITGALAPLGGAILAGLTYGLLSPGYSRREREEMMAEMEGIPVAELRRRVAEEMGQPREETAVEVAEELPPAPPGEMTPVGYRNPMYGRGFFGDIWSAVKKVVNPVVQRVKDVVSGPRNDYPPKVRRLLQQIGDRPIVQMYVRRDPIQSALNSALNFITLGKWNEVRKKYNYDDLFHLGLEVVIRSSDNADVLGRYVIEKNEVINIEPAKAMTPKTQIMMVNMGNAGMTINKLLDGGKSILGAKFFPYDAFTNNCQDFIMSLLLGSGFATPALTAFVKQPIEQVYAELPGYTGKVAKTITDLGGLANVALEGRGGNKPMPRFAKQLAKLGITPDAYLKEARRKAKAHDLVAHLIGFSDDDKHKLQVPNADGKIIRFGATGLGDHILYTLSKDPKADDHRRRYLARATKIKGDWKSDEYSPNSLAITVLW